MENKEILSDEECPECGEEGKMEKRERNNYEDDVVETKKTCWNCGHDEVIDTRDFEEQDKRECRVCGDEFMPEKLGDKFCNLCEENKLFPDTYTHNFGFLLPKRTGVVFEQQTQGVMCHKVYLEGVFMLLRKPHKKKNYEDGEWEVNRDLLSELRDANYNYNHEEANEIWEDIQEEMGVEFESAEPPENYPNSQEGLKWVKITDLEIEDNDYSWRTRIGEDLEGKTIGLIYPNCD